MDRLRTKLENLQFEAVSKLNNLTFFGEPSKEALVQMLDEVVADAFGVGLALGLQSSGSDE